MSVRGSDLRNISRDDHIYISTTFDTVQTELKSFPRDPMLRG